MGYAWPDAWKLPPAQHMHAGELGGKGVVIGGEEGGEQHDNLLLGGGGESSSSSSAALAALCDRARPLLSQQGPAQAQLLGTSRGKLLLLLLQMKELVSAGSAGQLLCGQGLLRLGCDSQGHDGGDQHQNHFCVHLHNVLPHLPAIYVLLQRAQKRGAGGVAGNSIVQELAR